MNLTLDHEQRLNLYVVLDALECQGRRDVFAVCRIQETIQLSDEERKHIQYRTERTPDGREFALWSRQETLPIRDYEFSQDDIQRICRALDKFPVILARDKNWFKPLIAQLPIPAETNGTAASAGGMTA